MPVRPRFEEGRKAWDGETAQILSRVAFRSVETDTQPGHCRKPELPSLGSVQADFPHANSQQRRSAGGRFLKSHLCTGCGLKTSCEPANSAAAASVRQFLQAAELSQPELAEISLPEVAGNAF